MLHDQKEWLVVHQKNMFLLFGLITVGLLCFEGGFLYGRTSQSSPMVISLPMTTEAVLSSDGVVAGIQSAVNQNTGEKNILEEQKGKTCLLVGSRNSNKYHLSSCAVAKRIKSENKVCFASKEEAEKRGYIAGCIK